MMRRQHTRRSIPQLAPCEDSAPNSVLRDLAKEPLRYAEPRTAGRRQVDLESRVARQPALHVRMLVRSVVVRNEVDLLAARCNFVDHTEKLQPFLVAVSVV